MRWQRAGFVFGAVALLDGVLAVGCVDGVTPNCSDPAVACGPNVDGASDRVETSSFDGNVAVDGAADSAADSPIDADAGSDAKLDAGDAG